MSEYSKKIDNALKICKLAEEEALAHNEPVEVCYSGGKDSDVILQLSKMAGIRYRAIYKNTTIDPPGTLQHVKNNNVDIVNPRRSFFEIIKKKGLPSFKFRFCCSELKEYKILNVSILGIRREESSKRKLMYTTFEQCRHYTKNVIVRQYFPILDWNINDIKKFVIEENIQLAPIYYTNGVLDITRRLGCMGCPLAGNKIKDFLSNKNFLRAYLRAGAEYAKKHNKNIYELFLFQLFFSSLIEMKDFLYRNVQNEMRDPKTEIENFFNIKLPDYEKITTK